MKQQSREWFAARKGRLTGSRVGAALGVNPYKTQDALIREMVREMKGAPAEFVGNVATRWGSEHEPLVMLDYMSESGNTVEECGLVVHPEHDWLAASPDGFVGTDGVVEFKAPFGLRNDDDPEFKSLAEQPHYAAQVQMELHCSGRQWCDFVQWTPRAINIERVEIDPHWLSDRLYVLRDFMARLDAELDNPEHLEPRRTDLSGDYARRLVEEYEQHKAAIDASKEAMAAIVDELAKMSGGKDAEIFGHKLTLVTRKGSVDWKRAVKDAGIEVDEDAYRRGASEYWRLS